MAKAQTAAANGKPVVLDAAKVAEILGLDEIDAVALVGAGVRVPASWPDEYAARLGPLALTFAECSLLTGTPEKTLHHWRTKGILKIRAVGSKNHALRVAPAELVRVMRLVAAQRNGATSVTETPAQQARRGKKDREAALAVCRGSG